MNIKIPVVFLILSFCVLTLFAGEEEKILLLKVGNRSLKDKVMDISGGKIYSALRGKPIPFQEMIREMAKSRFLYLGESHDSLLNHDIQLKVIQALHHRDRNLVIGIEMMPSSKQEILNKWSLGLLTPEEFLQEARWYVHWNLNFAYYQKIFLFAKENKIPLYALNAPRALIHKIRLEGWEALSDAEKELIPQPDLSHKEHRQLIRTIFESTPIPHPMKEKGLDMAFEGLYRAQSAWDEVMAHRADITARREGKRMIVLAGSAHFLYNLGVNRRAYERNRLPFYTLVCVEVPEAKTVRVSRSLADFVWGIPEEGRPAYPSIGLRLKKVEGLDNLIIESQAIEGVAKGSDFQKGDIILSVDERRFLDINELRMYLARFQWGDEVRFRILRQGEIKEIDLKFIYKREADLSAMSSSIRSGEGFCKNE